VADAARPEPSNGIRAVPLSVAVADPDDPDNTSEAVMSGQGRSGVPGHKTRPFLAVPARDLVLGDRVEELRGGVIRDPGLVRSCLGCGQLTPSEQRIETAQRPVQA
jgi:hypothetical protein